MRIPSWWVDACRLRVGLLKRPQPQVPHLTRPKFDAELQELEHFANWLMWVYTGRVGYRPAFDKRVPKWAWLVLGEYEKAHPKGPPATSPPPPPKPPEPSWRLTGPVVFTAWDSSAARTGPWVIADIRVPGVCPLWTIRDQPPAFHDAAIAQAETGPQQTTALDFLDVKDPYQHRALVATQGGWLPSKPFLDAGVNTVMVEAYQNEDPSHTPKQLVWQAQHDGWPYVWPVVGCYHGYALSNYDLSPYGKNFGVWLAEEMTDDDWTELERLCQ